MQLLIIPDWTTTLTEERRGALDALSGRLSDVQIRHFFAPNALTLTTLLEKQVDKNNLLVFMDDLPKEGEPEWVKVLNQAGISRETWKQISELDVLTSETIKSTLEGWAKASGERAKRSGRPEQ